MRLLIIDSMSNVAFWEKAIGGSATIELREDAVLYGSPEAAVVSVDYTGGRTAEIADRLNRARVPSAAVTSDTSEENQKYLFGLGFDDVICLPIYDRLLARRIHLLAADTGIPEVSISSLTDVSCDSEAGAYFVGIGEFTNIYKFVLRLLKRLKKNAQMLIITAENCESCRKQTMDILSEVVKMCLRRGDMSSIFGTDQMLILLIGADDEGGHLVANRITNSFYSACEDYQVELSYDLKAVGYEEE